MFTKLMNAIEASLRGTDPSADPALISGQMDAACESVVDLLDTAEKPALDAAFRSARTCLNAVNRADIDESSPAFLAGRLTAMTDILGYAAAQTVDPDTVKFVSQGNFPQLIAAMSRDIETIPEIAKRAGLNGFDATINLGLLMPHNVVVRHRIQGKVMFSLSPLGSLIQEHHRDQTFSA